MPKDHKLSFVRSNILVFVHQFYVINIRIHMSIACNSHLFEIKSLMVLLLGNVPSAPMLCLQDVCVLEADVTARV